ncbi:MAG: hypothetical protein WCY36_07350 [Candidatus Omnitrophota bacterium]
MYKLVEVEELFEPTHSALKRINEYLPNLAKISEDEFEANIDKVVDLVCEHFGIV